MSGGIARRFEIGRCIFLQDDGTAVITSNTAICAAIRLAAHAHCRHVRGDDLLEPLNAAVVLAEAVDARER